MRPTVRSEETSTTETVALSDSLQMGVMTERKRTEVTVPQSEVTLTIRTDSLAHLPEGAVYRAHEGQASVEVSHLSATATEPERIVVYATCDSLLLMCEEYERTVWQLNERIHRMQENIQKRAEQQIAQNEARIKTLTRGFVTGLLVGMVAICVLLIIGIIKRH